MSNDGATVVYSAPGSHRYRFLKRLSPTPARSVFWWDCATSSFSAMGMCAVLWRERGGGDLRATGMWKTWGERSHDPGRHSLVVLQLAFLVDEDQPPLPLVCVFAVIV